MNSLLMRVVLLGDETLAKSLDDAIENSPADVSDAVGVLDRGRGRARATLDSVCVSDGTALLFGSGTANGSELTALDRDGAGLFDDDVTTASNCVKSTSKPDAA